jgi:hypothetical protein
MPPYQLEEPFESFEILDLTNTEGLERLTTILVADPLSNDSPAAHAILDILTQSVANGDCQCAVVEHDYFDQEYSRAYQKFYSRSYPHYDRYSTRIHFFGRNVSPRDLGDLETRAWRGAYLGYCVVRPLHGRKIGRTVIEPRLAEPAGDFPLTLSRFRVNLAGSELTVGGAPFLEQDGGAAVCASCAIWMSTAMAGQRFGLPTSTPAEITELATGFPLSERVLGSTGLRAEEMETALRRMGYNSLFLGISDRQSALQAIHPYLEGGIAPILLLQLRSGGHAAVAVGHGYDPTLAASEPASVNWEGKTIQYRRSSDWINNLLVHDDQRGPFRRLKFLDAEDAESEGLHEFSGCPVEIDMTYTTAAENGGWPASSLGALTGAIIPVPPRISMTGVEAEEKSARLVNMLFETLGGAIPSNIVLRTFLAQSNEFKRRTRVNGLPRQIQTLYRSKPLPRWIWVTELCTVDDVTAGSPHRRQVRGEVILDGNGSLSTPDFVALHVLFGETGYLALMKPSDQNVADALEHGLIYKRARRYQAW